MEKKIFKGFYHIWAWQPSWLTDRDHFSNLSFPHPKEAPYEIWAKLAQRLQRRSRLKMLTDGRTDDGRKVITRAHPEQSSGELKSDWCVTVIFSFFTYQYFDFWWRFTVAKFTIRNFYNPSSQNCKPNNFLKSSSILTLMSLNSAFKHVSLLNSDNHKERPNIQNKENFKLLKK